MSAIQEKIETIQAWMKDILENHATVEAEPLLNKILDIIQPSKIAKPTRRSALSISASPSGMCGDFAPDPCSSSCCKENFAYSPK